MHGSLSQLMAEKAGVNQRLATRWVESRPRGQWHSDWPGLGGGRGARSEGCDEWLGSACEDSWRRSKSNVQHQKEERGFVRRDETRRGEKTEDKTSQARSKWWTGGCMGSCSCGAERERSWRANRREKQPVHARRDERREPEEALRTSRHGPPDAYEAKQSKAVLSKQGSKQASKPASKQTTFQPPLSRAEGASKRLQRCWPACRSPGCQMQRGPKDPVAALRGAQVDPDWQSAASASRRFRLHVLALAFAPHEYIGQRRRGMAEDWAKERQSLDEGEPGSRVGARSRLKRWNTRARGCQACFGTLFEALWVKKVEGWICAD